MRHVLVLAACAVLGACSTGDVASRGMSQPSALAYAPAYTLAGVEVDVPRSLSVSEANRIYPFADIVWRGEERGDRYEQVAAIFRDGAGIAAGKLTQGPSVVAHIKVQRFHSVTERAMHHTGGDHDMRFTLTLRDAVSGKVVMGPRPMHAVLPAFGGAAAVQAASRGETMRVRIVNHIGGVLLKVLSEPRGIPAAPPAPAQMASVSATF